MTIQGTDEPIWQQLRTWPASPSGYYSDIVADDRGTNRYLYMFINPTYKFWRYDTYTDSWQVLADPNGTYSLYYGIRMTYDPSRNRIWSLHQNSGYNPVFQYYDITNNTWTSINNPDTPGYWASGGSLIHTCTDYNNQGDDDKLYFYAAYLHTYSIQNDTWTDSQYIAGSGTGTNIQWLWGYDKYRKFVFLTSSILYSDHISQQTFNVESYLPTAIDTAGGTYHKFSVGTSIAYDGDKRIYIGNGQWQRFHHLQLDEGRYYVTCAINKPTVLMEQHSLKYIKATDNTKYLYWNQSDQLFYRTKIN